MFRSISCFHFEKLVKMSRILDKRSRRKKEYLLQSAALLFLFRILSKEHEARSHA